MMIKRDTIIMKPYDEQAERNHLIAEASKLFPNASVKIEYDDELEAIHLDIDGARYTFYVGSDNDAYVFCSDTNRIVMPALDD
jgi:hypothetical protein